MTHASGRIEAGEGHKGIGTFEWNSLERIEHAAANDGAHSADLAQARVVLLALGTRLDELLDPRVEACLYRIENGTIAEHWDNIESIPPQTEWKNQNGKF
jgi:hypothetical protein